MSRVAKYIPAEAVTFFLAVKNLIEKSTPTTASQAAQEKAEQWMNIAFVIALVLLPFYLRLQREPGGPWIVNTVIAVFAFPIWVYALSCQYGWFSSADQLVAGLLVLTYTFAVGAVAPK